MLQANVPPLDQQTVLITGAANGLGNALARAFGAVGAKLVLVDFDEKGLQEIAGSLPRARAYVADLSNAEATRAMIAAVRSDHEAVHTLIHNAGFLMPQAFAEMPDERWDLMFNVGIQAARLLTKAFWADWQKAGGAAIYVSSRSGVEAEFGEAAYCSTKHALEGFVKALAIEGEASGTMVHSVTPGMYMRTPMSEQNYTPELKEKWVDPIELTPAFLYLAMRPDKELSGKRLSAWELSQRV
jgi:NAD(P)-dependent dehydrogenase (short-subunit alcohol dehydrogenase family)